MGSASQPMLVIKANRALLKKRKFKDIKDLVIQECVKTELEFKEVSPEKLKEIKAEIRKKAKEEAIKEGITYLLCAAVVLAFLFWLLL